MYDLKDKALIEALAYIPDPRKKRGIRYKYTDLMLMAIYAILSGYSGGGDIADYVEMNFEYFSKLLGIKKAPSHDTFSRIVRMTDFDYLSSTLGQWLSIHYPEIYKEYDNFKVLHIDGKSVRAATAKSEGEKPVYLLNAMYEGGTISLYTKQIGDKENETGQIVDFLSAMDLNNTIVTIDAAGTTEPILNHICNSNGYYLVPVKKNQKRLYETIEKTVEGYEKSGKFDTLKRVELTQSGHGRKERIRTTMISNTAFIFEQLGLDSFYGTIARVGVMDKLVSQKIDGKEQVTETRTFLITNLESISVENMQSIKLAHWNIEMQHWILDVQLNEDRDTSRKENAIKNNSIIKRFCMHIKYNCKYKEYRLSKFFMNNLFKIENVTEILAAQTENSSS